MTVRNVDGTKVHQEEFYANTNDSRMFNIATRESGLYFVSFQHKAGIETKKTIS